MPPLKEKWKAFLSIILDPLVILLLLSTVILFILTINRKDTTDATVIAILTVLVGLSSSVLGGIVAKRWDDITEERVIETRAKSASRSLELLLSSTITLERRVRLFIERYHGQENKELITPEVIKTYFEEIVKDCLGLEEKIINSIEDWKDILPKLELKTVLNLIRDLNESYDQALSQLSAVNAELQETKDKSKEEIDKLKEEKKELTEEIFQNRKQSREKSQQVGVPSLGGSLITGSYDSVEHPYLPYDSPSPSFLGLYSVSASEIKAKGTIVADQSEDEISTKLPKSKEAKE